MPGAINVIAANGIVKPIKATTSPPNFAMKTLVPLDTF
jgi:hypothetical protein